MGSQQRGCDDGGDGGSARDDDNILWVDGAELGADT